MLGGCGSLGAWSTPRRARGRAPRPRATRSEAPDAGALGADRLAVLYRIARALLAERDAGAVIERILRAAVEALSAERACVLALAADGTPRALGEHGLSLGAAPEDWPISLSVVRHVAQTGLAVLASDIRGDAAFKGSASVHRFRIRSLLAVPLGPRPSRGVLYLDTQAAERSFSAADLDFATALGAQAALVLDRALEHADTLAALARSDERLELLQAELLRHEIVGRSPALLSAYDALRRFARGGARVLLRGETGTGKELFARAYALESGRGARGWVPVPIPALSPTLVESELFGHVRGAFTEATRDKKGRLELADGGVLFLDEIGDVEPAVQTKLLRFLDSGELVRVGDTTARRVDALVVCATNRPLEQDVDAGRFRGDLLARLGQTVVLPPLRDRPEDVPLLVEHARARLERGRSGPPFRARDAGAALALRVAVQRAGAAAGGRAGGLPRRRRRDRAPAPARGAAARRFRRDAPLRVLGARPAARGGGRCRARARESGARAHGRQQAPRHRDPWHLAGDVLPPARGLGAAPPRRGAGLAGPVLPFDPRTTASLIEHR